ncbi:TPM domain-containing protein [Spirulina subsalsa FACHB-351]|uniref:TPM domain-containing protein n=1 Tax=Spirulina subsalsa FACHB-351 TaxID=234711 RepID=A0ABT3L902_9CYAN|nr:TPM domain-containing protein [Spirulina subsalsa]MCW6037985.1 TPM domain-containing protein [Spirulina subsalsa FACHB-351]
MPNRLIQRLFTALLVACVALSTWSIASPAKAVDNPALLPDIETPVIDLANFLPTLQEESLIKQIDNFEKETGWKLRVLTQYDQTPGRSVKEYWGLDDRSVLLVADARGGNLLAFNVGDELYNFLPRTFWVELQTRFGNLYYVRENGENNSIVNALDAVSSCLREGGCNVVPGLPREQWILTLITSILGGVICGLASVPRQKDQVIAWQWALIFSPLWGILFIAFGLGPVVTRTADWLPVFRNVLGFTLGFLVAYLSPMMNRSLSSEPEMD